MQRKFAFYKLWTLKAALKRLFRDAMRRRYDITSLLQDKADNSMRGLQAKAQRCWIMEMIVAEAAWRARHKEPRLIVTLPLIPRVMRPDCGRVSLW